MKLQTKKKLTFISTAVVLCLTLFMSSCGQGGGVKQDIVKEVSVVTSLEDGDVYLSLAILFKIGTTNMTSITLPIVNPNNQVKYGEISFKPTLTPGYNEVKLKFNMSFAAEVNGGYATLPNGKDLPIGGLDESDVIELGIDQIHSKIYLALKKDLAMFGFAVAIKQFDVLSDYLQGANIFLGFDIKGVLGTVGIFTGDDEWESGLAMFLDVSKYLTNDIINDMINQKEITPERFEAMQSRIASQTVDPVKQEIRKANFGSRNLSRKNGMALYKAMRKLKGKTVNYVERK